MVYIQPQNNSTQINVSSSDSGTAFVKAENNNSKYYADLAKKYENNATIWAEGTDAQVQTLGGTHSAKKWADLSNQVNSDWTETSTTSKAYILNKPTIETTPTSASANLVTSGGIYNALQNKANNTQVLFNTGCQIVNQSDGTSEINAKYNDDNYVKLHSEDESANLEIKNENDGKVTFYPNHLLVKNSSDTQIADIYYENITKNDLSNLNSTGQTIIDNKINLDCSNVSSTQTVLATTDADNFTSTGKTLISGLSMPSSTYTNLTLGAGGTRYTAPANGWIQISMENPGGSWINIVNISDGSKNMWQPALGSVTTSSAIMLPVRKGLVWQISYSTVTTSVSWFSYRFVYAEGEPNT